MRALTGNRIKQLRNEKGLSEQAFRIAFAEFTNRETPYSIMTVSSWETGRKLPPSETLIELAHFFDSSVDYVLGLSSDRVETRNSSDSNEELHKIKVNYTDLANYDGKPLFITFPDGSMNDQYGLIDMKNKQAILINQTISLSKKCVFYKTVPPEEITIMSKPLHLLNLRSVKMLDSVYIKSLSQDPVMQGEVNGWYKNDVSGKFLINDLGRTLSYDGLGITYNAYDFKNTSDK